MYYIVSFVIFARRSDPVLLWGPDGFDIFDEYRKYKERIDQELGTEPNFLIPRSNWAMKALEILRKYQIEYSCKGDYEAIFIEHLIQRCGFERRSVLDCRLG